MISEQAIKKLKNDAQFQELFAYIVSQIEELDTVDNLLELSNLEAGEEAKVRAKAKQKLYEIMEPFIKFSEKKEPTAEEIETAKKRVGL